MDVDVVWVLVCGWVGEVQDCGGDRSGDGMSSPGGRQVGWGGVGWGGVVAWYVQYIKW